MSPRVQLTRLLVIVFAGRPFPLVFGIDFAGMFKHPSFSIGVIGWLIGGAVDLTQAIEYLVQTGRARSTSLEWLFPLTGFRATESGIDCRIFGVIAVVVALMSVTTWSAIIIFGI